MLLAVVSVLGAVVIVTKSVDEYEGRLKDLKRDNELRMKDLENDYERKIKETELKIKDVAKDYEGKIKDVAKDYEGKIKETELKIKESEMETIRVKGEVNDRILDFLTRSDYEKLRGERDERIKKLTHRGVEGAP